MKYQSATAFRAAIDARLKQYAHQHGEAALARLRRQIAFDRFLARLISEDPGNWALKGGMALDFRLGERARATRDLDLLHDFDMEQIDEVFDRMEASIMDDFFAFTILQTDKLSNLIDGTAVRYQIQANLDRRKFDQFSVDIGFDQTPGMRTDLILRPGFLEFAGLMPVKLPVLAIEYHLAEKLHAYSKTYPEGRTNSRVKDLVDMVLIGSSFELRASNCIEAIRQTFAARAIQNVPTALAPPPGEWIVSYPAMATSVSLDPDITAGHAFAAALFDPLLSGSAAPDAAWQSSPMAWLLSADTSSPAASPDHSFGK